MDSITIEGIAGYNGEYPLDIEVNKFSNRELHFIKQHTGLRAGELVGAYVAGDNDLLVAVAAVAIRRRKGEWPDMDKLWDADSGKIKFNFESKDEPAEEDGEDIPLPTENGEPETTSDEPPSDGETSNGSSGLPASVLSRIGAPG